MTIKLMVDTDMGLDDMLALVYLSRKSDVEIVGVSVTGVGLSHRTAGAQNALNWLDWLGLKHVPVFAGASEPTSLSNQFPPSERQDADSNYGLVLPHSPRKAVVTGSVADFYAACTKGVESFDVLSIGGLTHWPVLMADASLVSRVRFLTVMGGALDVAGNVANFGGYYPTNTTAEWNMFIDPKAASQVLTSSLPWKLVPLDACQQVPLTQDFLGQLRQHQGQALVDVVLRLLVQVGNQFYFFDPLAACIAANTVAPGYACEKTALSVVCNCNEEQDESGRIFRQKQGPQGFLVRQVDPKWFYSEFLETILQ